MSCFIFSWNPHKNEINKRKHGIAFELAIQVFQDPIHKSIQDRVENGEERWQTIGRANGEMILLVAHTVFVEDANGRYQEHIRIVSARKLGKHERHIYENA